MAGHAAGDHLLQVIAQRLAESVTECDLVARMGGDEFAVIVQTEEILADKKGFMKQLLKRINEPVDLDGTMVNPGMSFGVSTFPDDAKDAEALLSYADIALQQAEATIS